MDTILDFIDDEPSMFFGGMGLIIFLLFTIWMVITMWKIFKKADLPGWGSLIPIYNLILIIRMASKPDWWIFLFFIPFINLVAFVVVNVDLAKNFGKDIGFAIGMIYLSFIFFPILAFGEAEFNTVA